MTRAELIANLEATAAQLTGRTVTIRIKELPNALGMKTFGITQRDLSGRAVVDLDPTIFENVKEFAETFTHELAHVVKHFWELPCRDIEQGIAQQVQRQALHLASNTRGNPIVKRSEDEAETLAAEWMKAVNRHYIGYLLATHSPIMAVLQILYHKTK